MRPHPIRSILFIVGASATLLLSVGVAASAGTCCVCGHSCSGDAADFAACYQYCQSQGDTFVNYHEDKACSELKACDQGACCDRKPECKEMTRLGCGIDAAGKGFLPGKTCADCPAKKPLKQIMVVATKLVDQGDGTLVAHSYYVVVEIARLTKDSGYKGYVIQVPRTEVRDEHGEVPLEQRGDVQAGRVTREDLSDDQWKKLKEVLDGLGLNPSGSLRGIFDDIDADVAAEPTEQVSMISVSAPAEAPDPADPFGEHLVFSHWEIHVRNALEAAPSEPNTEGGLWDVHTVFGSSDDISIGNNAPGVGIAVQAFHTKGHRVDGDGLGDPYAEERILMLRYLEDVIVDATPTATVTMSYQRLDDCTEGRFALDDMPLEEEDSIDLEIGDDLQVTISCDVEDDYAAAIPEDVRDCARILAWHSGNRHRTRFDERWDARENSRREMCDACGAPMCVVCMEYDLGTYESRSGVTASQRRCHRTVERYLRTATRGETEILAAVYWEAYWDGRHGRNQPD